MRRLLTRDNTHSFRFHSSFTRSMEDKHENDLGNLTVWWEAGDRTVWTRAGADGEFDVCVDSGAHAPFE